MPLTPLATMSGHSGYINQLCELDRNTLVSASNDKTIKLWCTTTTTTNTTDTACLKTIRTPDNAAIRDVSVINSETILIVSSHYARIIRVIDGEIIANSFATTHALECCTVLSGTSGIIGDKRGGIYKVSWSNSRTIKLDLYTQAHGTSTVQRVVSDGRETFATCSWDRTAKLWDSATHRLIHTYRESHRRVNCIVYNRLYLITASSDKIIRVYSIRDGTRLSDITTHQASITSLCFINTFKLVSTSTDNIIATHDIPSGNCIIKHNIGFCVSAVKLLSNHKIAVASSGETCSIFLYDIDHVTRPTPPPPIRRRVPQAPHQSRKPRIEALIEENRLLRQQLGAKQQHIDTLRQFIAFMKHSRTLQQDDTNSEFCCIELEPFLPGDEVLRLPCMHVHHAKCVLPYLKRSNAPECPICRTAVLKEHIDFLPTWKWNASEPGNS